MPHAFGGFKNIVTAFSSDETRIHQGTFFISTVTRFNVVDGGALDIIFVVPDGIEVYLKWKCIGTAFGVVSIYNDPIVTLLGTPGLISNFNTGSVLVAQAAVYPDATIALPGTNVGDYLLPGGDRKQDAFGSQIESVAETRIAPGTSLTRITNTSADPADYQFISYWYEPYTERPVQTPV
jgi:hypothetical protein